MGLQFRDEECDGNGLQRKIRALDVFMKKIRVLHIFMYCLLITSWGVCLASPQVLDPRRVYRLSVPKNGAKIIRTTGYTLDSPLK